MKNLPLAVLALLVPALAAQSERPPVQVTTIQGAHASAVISPDGTAIAYVFGADLGAIDTDGRNRRTLVANSNPTSFVWAPDSRAVYYTSGLEILRVSRGGGAPTRIGTASGQNAVIWSVDSRDRKLYGTRFDPALSNYYVFEIATSAGSPLDLVTSQNILANVMVDPSDAYLLYTAQGTQPFDPIEIWRVDATGANGVNMAGGAVGTFVRNPRWIDNGDRAVYAGLDSNLTLQVMRVDRTTQAVVPLTSFGSHQRTNVTISGGWIVLETTDGLGGNGPAVMPIDGGGLVYLYTRQPYQYTGSPTIDDAGTAVVFSGKRSNMNENANIWRMDLDGEMRVHPRAELGNALVFELPASANEVGVIFVALRGTPFALPGVQFDFQLDAAFAILTIAQGGANPIVSTLPIPNLVALQGLRLYFQGLRYDPSTQSGEMTRYGVFTVF